MLIKCTECGHEFSDKASFCPHCGIPVEYVLEAQEQNQTNSANIDNHIPKDSTASTICNVQQNTEQDVLRMLTELSNTAPVDRSSKEELKERAKNAKGRGNSQAAQEYFNKVFEMDPNDPEASFYTSYYKCYNMPLDQNDEDEDGYVVNVPMLGNIKSYTTIDFILMGAEGRKALKASLPKAETLATQLGNIQDELHYFSQKCNYLLDLFGILANNDHENLAAIDVVIAEWTEDIVYLVKKLENNNTEYGTYIALSLLEWWANALEKFKCHGIVTELWKYHIELRLKNGNYEKDEKEANKTINKVLEKISLLDPKFVEDYKYNKEHEKRAKKIKNISIAVFIISSLGTAIIGIATHIDEVVFVGLPIVVVAEFIALGLHFFSDKFKKKLNPAILTKEHLTRIARKQPCKTAVVSESPNRTANAQNEHDDITNSIVASCNQCGKEYPYYVINNAQRTNDGKFVCECGHNITIDKEKCKEIYKQIKYIR